MQQGKRRVESIWGHANTYELTRVRTLATEAPVTGLAVAPTSHGAFVRPCALGWAARDERCRCW